MSLRVAIYSRVSTSEQSTDNQKRELCAVAQRMGWTIVREYEDAGISGASDRALRPGFNDLLKGVARREFDLIACWSVDRLGRSLQDLVATLGDIQARNIGLYLHQQNIDTTTPSGKAMFQMCGVFAEFERAMMQERIKAGLAKARAAGRRLGRPKISLQTEDEIRAQRKRGLGIRKIASSLGVGVSTVQRVVGAVS